MRWGARLLAITPDVRRFLRVLSRGAAHVWRVRAELLVAVAVVGGWSLVTLAVARLAPASIVWPASGGLFLLSLSGWRFLWALVGSGLYSLTREDGRG